MPTHTEGTPAPVHLVPHTHWDREWYRPFQSFRMQLVDMIDRVLDMLEADDEFAFTLDGQLATVDDYLEVRPEAEERIRRHVASGRLAIGPWLILMDEFLVSGETIVRNLQMGWRRAHDFGAPMRIGYLPDMFGHIAQMPQILARAGLTDAVVWRGIPAAIERHQFRWEAPDGSAVRAEYLPAGYGNAAYLFAVPERLDGRLDHFAATMRPYFGDDPLLAMYGTDHTAPVPQLTALVRQLNALEASDRVRIGTLADYVAAAPPLAEDAACWRGEMRSGARANVLMGVASARVDLKAAAARAERQIERYAEPLQALWAPPESWPAPFLELAWRRLVENSAHDSICGCSVDAVVSQVLVRYAEAEQIGSQLGRRAAIGVSAQVPRGTWIALNPSPSAREGLVKIEAIIPEDWDEVAVELPNGSLAATQEVERRPSLLFEQEIAGREIGDVFRRFHGREIFDRAWNGYRIGEEGDRPVVIFEVDDEPRPLQLDVEALRGEVEAALLAHPDRRWTVRILAMPRRRLYAQLPVPALGWTWGRPVEGTGEVAHPVSVDGEGRELANGLVSVRVADDGTLTLEAADGTRLAGVGRIVDGGDLGDSYNYGPPVGDRLVDVPEAVTVQTLEAGRLRSRLAVRRRFAWPSGLAADGSARSDDLMPTEVTTEIELRAGEPFVRLAIAFENRSTDHRVRFHVPLAEPAAVSHAEGQFAVVARGLSAEGGYREEPIPTYPARGWVDAGGVAALLDHVVEYELVEEGRELVLTVLRATGLISRNDNPYRLDPAGPEIPIPDAQLRGPLRIAFGLFPHAGGWDTADVPAVAERYQHGLLSAPGCGPDDAAPPPRGVPGLAIEGGGVVLSALRRLDDGWLELRVVNLRSEAVTASVGGDLVAARGADLLLRPGDALPLAGDGRLELQLDPAEIRTVHLRRREPAQATAEVIDMAGPRRDW